MLHYIHSLYQHSIYSFITPHEQCEWDKVIGVGAVGDGTAMAVPDFAD